MITAKNHLVCALCYATFLPWIGMVGGIVGSKGQGKRAPVTDSSEAHWSKQLPQGMAQMEEKPHVGGGEGEVSPDGFSAICSSPLWKLPQSSKARPVCINLEEGEGGYEGF